jgi:uncharacterized protein YbaA (DUF1428 family)/uncharacterized protein YndB with AHSA1/START domain
MTYVDGFVAAVPTAKKEEWTAFTAKWAPVFQGFGATRIVEAWGDDVPRGKQTDFYMSVQAKDDETVCFSWIEWPSKAARDAGMAKMMADPAMGSVQMPFDGKRMIIGGFAPVTDTNVSTHCGVQAEPPPIGERTLTLERVLDAPAEKLWRCWTEPALMTDWFCPKPWRVSKAEVDLRPGGVFNTVMNGPAGEVIDNKGQFLVVERHRRLVFTDAFVGDWAPSGKAFMVGEVEFAERGGRTHYTARARHWTAADTAAHDAMGFQQGWGVCADQLEALAKTL